MRNHSMVKANGSMSLAGIGALVLCILPVRGANGCRTAETGV